jgi:hypothetical protein
MWAIVPGDVIRIFDTFTRPNKIKWHICVCQHYGFFLRINSNPLYRPNFPLHASACPWLKHDSYVELRALHQFPKPAVDAALKRPDAYLGRLGMPVREALAQACSTAGTLTGEQQAYIQSRLTSEEDLADEEIWDATFR